MAKKGFIVSTGVSASSMISELVKNVCSTGSFLDKKYSRQNVVLPKEKLDKVGARLEHLSCKSSTRLVQQAQVLTVTAWRQLRSYIYCHIKSDMFKQLKLAIMTVFVTGFCR
jgi:hypothetical protein